MSAPALREGPGWRGLSMRQIGDRGNLAALDARGNSFELLKWVALLCMTLDHVNKYLLGGRYEALYVLGRLAMPIFAIVLGCNLARASDAAALSRTCGRTLLRLVLTGTVASAPFVALGGLGWGWWPLNIMFTFLVATVTIYLIGVKGWRVAAAVVAVLGGAFVEFWWPGVALCVAAWACAKQPTATRFAALAVGCLSTTLIGWALAHQPLINAGALSVVALPLVWLAMKSRVHIPRLRLFFYLYYPAHLVAIWALAQEVAS